MHDPVSSALHGRHGGDGQRVAAEFDLDPSSIIDLSASLNPFAPEVATLVESILRRDPGAITAYPDALPATLVLADALGVDPDRLVLTNGGAEAIALVADIERHGSIVEPEFSLYRRHLHEVTADGGRWRSNPSNPLGVLAEPPERARVWDEAFYPLATGSWSRGDDESWRLGSLTKLWACPGLRAGYVIAPTREEAELVVARQPRWPVNGLALGAIPELLEQTELDSWSTAIAELRARFAEQLRELGYDVSETTANWVLIEDARDLRGHLAPTGVIVRDCSSFGLEHTTRVALPHPAQLDRVLAAFASVEGVG